MKVSIIIPVYNVEPYVERCLLSALNQTYQNIEILLVDDCGIDSSMREAERIITAYPNGNKVIVLHHENNRGLSAARNTGIHAATGEYVYFLDSDDEIMLNCIECLVGYARRYEGVDMVQGGVLSSHMASLFMIGSDVKEYYDDNFVIKNVILKNKIPIPSWNKLIKTKFITDNNLLFKEGIVHEDNHWNFFMAKKIHTMAVCRKKLYSYTYRENSIVNEGFTDKRLYSLVEILDDFIENIDDVCVRCQKNRIFKDAIYLIESVYTYSLEEKLAKEEIISRLEKIGISGILFKTKLNYIIIGINTRLYLIYRYMLSVFK